MLKRLVKLKSILSISTVLVLSSSLRGVYLVSIFSDIFSPFIFMYLHTYIHWFIYVSIHIYTHICRKYIVLYGLFFVRGIFIYFGSMIFSLSSMFRSVFCCYFQFLHCVLYDSCTSFIWALRVFTADCL